MNFSRRVSWSFAGMAAIFVAVELLIAAVGMRRSDQFVHLVATQWSIFEAMEQARDHIHSVRGDALQAIISPEAEAESAVAGLDEKALRFYRVLDRLEDLMAESAGFAVPVRKRFQEYYIVATRILTERGHRSRTEIREELHLLRKHENLLLDTLHLMLEQQQSVLNSTMDSLKDRAGEVVRISLGIAAFALVVTILLAWRQARSLSRPIVSLRDAVRDIRSGKLDVQVQTAVGGEVGELAEAFNQMTAQLAESQRQQRTEEAKRRDAEERYLQAQKMEAVGQMAGGVAHDFNNMLQVILGFGEILLVEMQKHDEQLEMMNEMLGAADRSKILVSQLLAFSRRQVLSPENLDIGEVIDSIAKMIRRIIGEHISLQVQTESRRLIVHADRGQLEQVMMNLCINARDAMPSGGKITIETSAFHQSQAENGGGLAAGEYVRISVSDTGTGMDEATCRRIFEPFFTTKAEGKGTGLGLATVYGIVLQHEGQVNVESQLGEGTTFHIYLPAIDAQDADAEAAGQGELPTGDETILVVEDEHLVRQVAHRMLEQAGYTVHTAEDGPAALEQARVHGNSIDLLLCDVVMPGMSGPETAAEIISQYPQIRCLFASGYTSGGVHKDFILAADTEFVQKPFRMEVLLRRVREVLDRDS